MTIKSKAIDYRKPNMSTGSNIGSFSLGTDYKLSDNQTLSVQAWIETKGSKQSDFFSVSNRDEKYESNSLDDFNTDDYTIGLFYKGTVPKTFKWFFSNFSTKPQFLYEGAIFLRKFNIKN